MLIAVVCFAGVNAMAKWMDRIPVHELVFFRSLVSLAFCIWYVRRYRLSPWGNNRKWLILRGLFGLAALLLFFSTLKHMPLASATGLRISGLTMRVLPSVAPCSVTEYLPATGSL